MKIIETLFERFRPNRVTQVTTNVSKEFNKGLEFMPLLQKGFKCYGLLPTDYPSVLRYYLAALAYLVIFTIPMVR